jgi:hypothetical protein
MKREGPPPGGPFLLRGHEGRAVARGGRARRGATPTPAHDHDLDRDLDRDLDHDLDRDRDCDLDQGLDRDQDRTRARTPSAPSIRSR